MDYLENPNSNLSNTNLTGNSDPWSLDFELSEYLMLEDHHHHHVVDQDSTSQSMASSEQVMGGSSGSTGATLRNNNMQVIQIFLFLFQKIIFMLILWYLFT